ncbi:hypothetical protein D0962_18810 [Leptolyngbyaceae cyanobacterium CCMR0082]|uniref:Uncharacterized protein n=1 Tax=Adonisia turfae CCMR0082 TaxID=2304604 RepID=A0A6M0SAU5_9CYAN|nr:hypothetical protein [Adonisia turfae CCMR0082]
MSPIEKQNIENFRARLQARWEALPWHARLKALPIKAWRFLRWWRAKLHLERCWEMDEREGGKS